MSIVSGFWHCIGSNYAHPTFLLSIRLVSNNDHNMHIHGPWASRGLTQLNACYWCVGISSVCICNTMCSRRSLFCAVGNACHHCSCTHCAINFGERPRPGKLDSDIYVWTCFCKIERKKVAGLAMKFKWEWLCHLLWQCCDVDWALVKGCDVIAEQPKSLIIVSLGTFLLENLQTALVDEGRGFSRQALLMSRFCTCTGLGCVSV